jgi:hypothetical protein
MAGGLVESSSSDCLPFLAAPREGSQKDNLPSRKHSACAKTLHEFPVPNRICRKPNLHIWGVANKKHAFPVRLSVIYRTLDGKHDVR